MHGVIVALAVAAGVLMVAVVLFASARRTDREQADRAIGTLSRETRRRDRSDEALTAIAGSELQREAPRTGRELERAVELERRAAAGGVGTALAVPTAAAPPIPAPVPYIDEETLGVTRRQFLNRGILGMFGLAVAGFGAATLGFLWPTLSGGFGSKVTAGKIDDIVGQIRDKKAPFYVADARAYINPYPRGAVPKARASGAYSDAILAGMELGILALYQRCVHLGCRVPWCSSSQWFECPCHGSQYNRVGEKKGGPAPRGLDRFAVTIDNSGTVVIDTKTIFLGPPIGTNTTGQEAEGPHCR